MTGRKLRYAILTAMKYQYECEKCGSVKCFEMTVAEYEKFEAKCEKCKTKMRRVYKPVQVANSGGSSDASSSSACASCSSGSCSTCSFCG